MGIGRINLIFDIASKRKNINVMFDPLSKRININLPTDNLSQYKFIRIMDRLFTSNKIHAISILPTEISQSFLIQNDIYNTMALVSASITETLALSSSVDSFGELDFGGIISELGLDSDINAVIISIMEIVPNKMNLYSAALGQIDLFVENLSSHMVSSCNLTDTSAVLQMPSIDSKAILTNILNPTLTILLQGKGNAFVLNSKVNESLVQYRKMKDLGDMKVSGLSGMTMKGFFYIEL